MDFSAIAQIFSNLIFFALHLGSANLFPKPLSKKDEEIAVKKALDGDMPTTMIRMTLSQSAQSDLLKA